MRKRFDQFMSGRYGVDDLSKFMLGSVVVLMILNMFFRQQLVNMLIVVILALIYVRMLSRDIRKRWEENQKYLGYKAKVMDTFGGGKGAGDFMNKQKRRAEDLKENHIYKCPSCGQKIRIPRGKGKIMITCPKCRHEFEKKS